MVFADLDKGSVSAEGRQITLLKVFEGMLSAFGPQHWWPADGPFEMVVGAILTQNTSWRNVEKAIENLRSSDCLTPKAIEEIPEKDLAQLLRPSGYFNMKARRLKDFVRFLVRDYEGQMTALLKESSLRLREKLLGVKGIGPETADSILLYAALHPWFVVDAYTRRIFSRHRLVSQSISYQALQSFFMESLPQKTSLYNEYHALLVKVGKDFCRKRPLCEECPLYPILGEPAII